MGYLFSLLVFRQPWQMAIFSQKDLSGLLRRGGESSAMDLISLSLASHAAFR
jgi:hypothetical protein